MKINNLMIMVGILLLTACQTKQPISESRTSDAGAVPAEVSISKNITKELLEEADNNSKQDITGNPSINELKMPMANVPIVPQSEVWFDGYPEQTDYDLIAELAIEPISEQEGVFGGSPVIWSIINDGDFLHFYYTLTYPEVLYPEYAGSAIIGDNIKLPCGLHVGMSVAEAEAIIPGLYHFKWENPEYASELDWNSNVWPDSWCQQFPQILIAEIDNDNEMPLTIGLFLDEQDIIRAIDFNCPTAG